MSLIWSYPRYRKALERHGFAYLAGGYYGSVLEHRKTHNVIKLCPDPGDGWPLYARLAIEKAISNPHYLRVNTFHPIGSSLGCYMDPFYVVSMERLVSWDSFDATLEERLLFNTVVKFTRGDAKRLVECHRFAETYSTIASIHTQAFGVIMAEAPLLAEALYDVCCYAEVIDATLDLHENNLMWRPSDRRIVITDPYSSLPSEEFQRRQKTRLSKWSASHDSSLALAA